MLLAIPLFTSPVSNGDRRHLPARLIDLARALIGHLRGGIGMAVVVAEMFFSGISGSPSLTFPPLAR